MYSSFGVSNYTILLGVPERLEQHADRVVFMAQEMVDCLRSINARESTRFQVRMGVHTGAVLSGVIGASKFIYDVWSDDVQIAAKMESTGQPDRVHLTRATADELTTGLFRLTPSPSIVLDDASGNAIETFFLDDDYDESKAAGFLQRSARQTPVPDLRRVSIESEDDDGSQYSYVDVTHSMILDQPTDEIITDMTSQMRELAERSMNPWRLVFRDKSLEADYRRKVRRGIGTFLFSMCLMLANYTVVIIATGLVYGVDADNVLYFIFWPAAAVMFLMVLLMWLSRRHGAMLSPRFLTMAGLASRWMNYTVIGIICLCLMFSSANTDFDEREDPLYIAVVVYLVLWNSTVLTLVHSFYLNLTILLLCAIFLILAGTLIPQVYMPLMDDFVPLTIIVMVGVMMANYSNEYLLRENFIVRRELNAQIHRYAQLQKSSEALLLSIFPASVAERLKTSPSAVIAERMDAIAILFASIINFSVLRQRVGPVSATRILNQIVCEFDRLADESNVEKIKTHGTTYMAIAGLGTTDPQQTAKNLAKFALSLQKAAQIISTRLEFDFVMKIGLNIGVVVGGVIGRRKFSFDLWGDAVNVASRMVLYLLCSLSC